MVETLGDVARLLDRVEALVPALNATHGALGDAGAQLNARLAEFQNEISAITQTAKTQVVQHVATRIEAAAKHAQQVQARAMAAAARELFRAEVEQSLQRLVASIEVLRRPKEHPWEPWLTHAAVAAAASAATWAVIAWPGLR